MDGSNSNHNLTSAQSTPRSTVSSTSGSARSFGSSSSPSNSSNYSFQQRNITIPPEIRRVDVAVLSSPLVRRRYTENLTPLDDDRLSGVAKGIGSELPLLSADGIHESNRLTDLKPHPPTTGKPNHRTRRGSQQTNSSQSNSDHEVRNQNANDIRRSSHSSRGSLCSPHVSDSEGKNHVSKDHTDPLEHKSINKRRQSSDRSECTNPPQAANVEEKMNVGFDKNLAMLLRENFNKQRADLEKKNSADHISPKDENTNDSVIVNKSIDVKKTTSENNETVLRKSDDDSLLINSYENYLRQLSQNEEDSRSEISNCAQEASATLDDELADAEDSSSESDSESLHSSVSVSSLSDDEDVNENTLTPNSNLKPNHKFEPLYSLPIKEKNNGTLLKPLDAEQKSTLNNSILSETSQHRYAILNESHLDSELRTQSVPDLRTGKSFRTLDTMGYMCPLAVNNDGKITSSPDLKRQDFNMKYRPLPDIPKPNRELQSDLDTTENGETIYEQLQTVNMTSSSPEKPKVSFKAVATRVVSLMPRLTTKEARSRETDRYMADIMQYLPDQTLRVYCGTWNMKGIKVSSTT